MAVEKDKEFFSGIRKIGDLSQGGVFVFDAVARRFAYVNDVVVQILELNRRMIIEDPEVLLRLLPHADAEYVTMRYDELQSRLSCEGVQVRISSNKVDKILSIDAYVMSEGFIAGFVRDISKEKEHEEYLINFGARKDTILDMVSQNLSTPLSLGNFTIDLIQKAVEEKKYHKLASHVRLMREVTAECIRIIDDFLQEEHLRSPEIESKSNRFDLVSKTLIVLEKLREANPEKQFRLTTSLKHLIVRGDDVKYFQVIHNLLSNSIKFTRPNGFIEVSIQQLGPSVEVRISDDGIGIPDELKPFVFERKSRASRPGLKGEVSNGIGLYVVHELTRKMKGHIRFESVQGKGTVFVLRMPRQ